MTSIRNTLASLSREIGLGQYVNVSTTGAGPLSALVRKNVSRKFQMENQHKTVSSRLLYTESESNKSFGRYNIVAPGKVSEMKTVPNHIKGPEYYLTGKPIPFSSLSPVDREISNQKQMEGLRAACKLARIVLNNAISQVQVGVTTESLDNFTHDFIIAHNAYPSPLNYKGFPKSICTSVNNVAIHGIPDDRPLADGDIINLDVTVYLGGYHGDCSETVCVGNVDARGKHLVTSARECLERGIYECAPGAPISTIGASIEALANAKGLTVIPVITGHGIGKFFHGPPDIYHIDYPYPGVMKPGMTFTIEPVISQGDEDVNTLNDGWTVVTNDGARTAQFEHTILITTEGYEILTK